MGGARAIIKSAATIEVPNHLRNAPVKGMAEQGYGAGYEYPHNHPGAVVEANYFPVGISPQAIYEPSDRGFEGEVSQRLAKIRSILPR
jgi:putative ATPase